MHAKDTAVFLALIGIFTTSAALAERVSVTSKGRGARGDSQAPVVSADGRLVAFSTTAKLVPEDTNGITDVYVHDRVTNRTRIVSDQLGGDQPTISANGRFVGFRSFEYYDYLPRIRMVDLERGGPSFSGGVQNLNSYYQPTDMPLLNPNGRFLAFAFRPAPNRTDFRDHEITVVDTVTRSAYAVLAASTSDQGIDDLGRFAMSADAKTFVFETTSALKDDPNTVSDVYLVRQPFVGGTVPETPPAPIFFRLSRPAVAGTDDARSYDPVISLDGTVAFFISEAKLTNADTDDRATIYAIDVAGNPGNLRPVTTQFTPVALAGGATISGKHLGYLAESPNGQPPKPRIVRVEDNFEFALAGGANGECEAPVLSGDDRVAVYASRASNLTGGDRNRSFDVFAEIPRNAPPARSAPLVALAEPADGDRPQTGVPLKVSSTATEDDGQIRMHTFEFNGWQSADSGSTLLNTTYTPAVSGLFTLQSRAFNDAWIEGRSAIANLTVRQPSVTFAIAGIEQLKRVDNADGSTNFEVTVAIENRGNVVSPPLTFLVTAASTAFTTNSSVDLPGIDTREEQVIAVLDTPALKALERRSVTVRGVTPPTENIGNAEQGLGWTVLGKLRSSGALFNTVTLFQAMPRLNENTFLPNGGVPTGGAPNTDTQFNPSQLQELQIQGRAEVAAGTRANYSARAVFNTGTKACLPTWSVQGPGVSISPDGVLNTRNVTSPATVTVKAAFAGQAASRKVKVRPVSPKISIRPPDTDATETGDAASFRIMRTPASSQALTVNYQISGSATSGQDYAALSGTVTIPAGASSANLEITPIQDGTAEGDEAVELTILPDPSYRLSSATEAKVLIVDDEAFPANQPDGILQYRDDDPIGAKVIDLEYGPVSGIETSQHLEIWGRKNVTETFTLTVVNRSATAKTYTLTGAAGALGFDVKYLLGDTDITAAVTGGTHQIPLNGEGTAEITVEITPTAKAAVGTYMNCELLVKNGSIADKLAIEVERVR